MGEIDVWWAVAGGWAIDLWLGRQTREHHDVEVAVRRCDQSAALTSLRDDWEMCCLDPPGSEWRPWHGDLIEAPAFQLQARSASTEFDIFLEETVGALWQFRRDRRITLPFSEVSMVSSSGLPVVRPAVQLLYMAKSTDAKNQHDFEVARPMLDRESAAWLAMVLAIAHPGHRWLALL